MKNQKLSKNDLAEVKSFYENEYRETLGKLEHLKKIILKLKDVGPALHDSEKAKEILQVEKTKPTRGRPSNKTAKATVTKRKPRKAKARKTLVVKQVYVKEKTARTYNRWSEILLGVLADSKKAMTAKEIISVCLQKKGISDIVEANKAGNSINSILSRMKTNNKVIEAKKARKGSKRKTYSLPA